MNVYRIAREKYIGDLTGEGAKRYGGRWNQKGTNVLYTSMHESLAALEVLVHVSISSIPKDFKILVLSVPQSATMNEIRVQDLPANWDQYPAPDILAENGTKWAVSKSTLLLKVPSVIIPSEKNILINPAHAQFSTIKQKEIRSFIFDNRLKK